MPTRMSAYDPIIARLLALHPKRIDLSLDRMWRILDELGHPERNIPPVIHVAGTNGKGSTIAFMRAMLEAAGQQRARLHLAASRSLQRALSPRRARGGGELVSDEALAAVLEECERANGAEPITVFEIETAAAFLLFSRQPADVTLLEVGLGGRLDATNVIEKPLACAITPVSMDHLEFLGDTHREDRRREGRDPQARCAGGDRAAVRRRARRHRATRRGACARRCGSRASTGACTASTAVWSIRTTTGCSICRCRSSPAAISSTTPAPPSRRCAPPGWRCRLPAFEAGIAKAEWPARMQRLTQGKLKALTPPESELWLDGGHNADGAPRGRGGDRRSRGARAAPAGADRRHALDQGQRGVPAQLRRHRAPRHRGAGAAAGEKRSGRDAGRYGAERRHSGREPRHARSGARRGGAARPCCPRRAS